MAISKTADSNSESFLGKTIDLANTQIPEIPQGFTNIDIINGAVLTATAFKPGASVDASIAIDDVNATGLSNLGKVLLDADATIAATSTAKSTADATNVSASSAGLAIVDGNFGLNGAVEIGVKSDAGLNATASTTVNAAASTSKGDAVSLASIQESAGIANIMDLDVGGELSAIGKAVNTITASAETVVNAGTLNDSNINDFVWNGAQATAELFGTQQGFNAQSIDSSSNASIQGISSLTNSATASVTTGDLALAEGLAGKLIGANLDGIDVGGIANVTGQTTFGNTSKASNVEGDAKAISRLGSADGLISKTDVLAPDLDTTAAFEVSSDATIKGLTSVTAGATAETTKGDAVASSSATNINGADFKGTLDIGGIGSIAGASSFNLSASANSVTGDGPNTNHMGGAQAFAGEKLLSADASNVSATNINALSSFGLKGINGSVTSAVNDTGTFGIDIASDATLTGTAIGSLNADAASTADDATAKAGGFASLTGAIIGDLHVGGIAGLTGGAQLTSSSTAKNVGDNLNGGHDALAASGLNATVTGLSGLPDGTASALQSFIDVASDATVTAQAFGTLNAIASSTGGDATAKAGNSSSVVTGLASGLDLDVGGVGTVSALAQGSEKASATSVDGIADADAGMTLVGAKNLNFDSNSDGTLTGIAKLVATVDAANIGSADNDALANGAFSAIGFSGLLIGDLASINTAAGVSPSVTGHADVVGIGGISTIKGQAQIAGTLNAESVSGDAFAGVNDIASMITGMSNVILNGASDGTLLGTASGAFNTNAIATGRDASAFSSQVLKGIDQLDLQLGGNGGINAIVNDTNFVGAQSVSGNATAVASVNAIGLDGGDMHIAGNASIMSTVGVDSKSESHTIA